MLTARRKITSRSEARRHIIQTANRFRLERARRKYYGWRPRLLTGRHLHEAVCVCRQHELVTPDLLVLAGFNSKGNR